MKVNQQMLADGLTDLGVASGIPLEVHCALGAFGPVEGGADAVIDALMEVVGPNGALVMPAFRLSPALPLTPEDLALGLTSKIQILPPDAPRTAMGIVSDTFRHRLDVVTGEGIFRTSAWGKDAALHAQTGFGHLIELDGYAALLGVDIYSLSAMHYVEDALPDAIRDRFAPNAEALARYPQGEWLTEAWTPPVRAWHTIQVEAIARGYVRQGVIGGAPCMLLPVQKVTGLYRQALQTDALALYGLR